MAEPPPSGRPGRSDRRRKVLILGAAGRDFHDFNVVFRDDPGVEVVAFTAAQIPGIADRRYPPALAGPHHRAGVAIRDEALLEAICREAGVDDVVFAYSDVTHAHVMHLASRAIAAGASFRLLGPRETMLESRRPVIAVSAVRTGCGKSPIARWLSRRLREAGLRCVAMRHPMPYGELTAVQRFATRRDLETARCTVEEREEYEPHIDAGNVVYAGADYAAILAAAEAEADVIVWDGGNNDFPFLRPSLHIVVVDALRPEQLTTHHPGEAVLRMADIVVVNKVDAARPEAVREIGARLAVLRPAAAVVHAASPVRLDDAEAVRGRRVVAVDDGPTLTHGGMAYGAARVAAEAAGAAEIVDPRPFAAPAIARIYAEHPHLDRVLPAVGYGAAQLEALRATIAACPADLVVSGTPIDLAALIAPGKPIMRARYAFAEAGEPTLASHVDAFVKTIRRA